MADIALVFHWPPGTLEPMGLDELARWREKARVRLEAMAGSQQGPQSGRTGGF